MDMLRRNVRDMWVLGLDWMTVGRRDANVSLTRSEMMIEVQRGKVSLAFEMACSTFDSRYAVVSNRLPVGSSSLGFEKSFVFLLSLDKRFLEGVGVLRSH